MVVACYCSLAGTAACRYCSQNPFAETPPTERTNTVTVTDTVLITGQKTNADRIRSMKDEELAAWLDELVEHRWLDWLKEEAET